ncbi:alkyl hydroperoxide reductase subunit F [Paraferrimonas sedimenticola]|uniref:Alkyl hydroperoxide reductase subunit F n=1 Tax=Paraferrimonas sedimenticola TaxID=375674 RepID=A0AA37W064_9GAMM|nr:alkyl hydroperoxide reductase subunit F [Paraferrimonas sedimenticola]GLP95053.1 alkyl hydroperoxide reductase subunit F [Paraferrimonas sedimenticola]
MLSNAILESLRGYTANLASPVDLVLQSGQHPKREELQAYLRDVASTSDKLSVREADINLQSPISFALYQDNEPSGIVFSGIPGGHEFSSLVLAILQAGGHPIKLDEGLKALVTSIDQPLVFQTFVSLSCHNCPDVVQTLNQFALLNPNISSEMIDGGLFQDLIEKHQIQGVPTVLLNGEVFANGKVEPAQLIDKLQPYKGEAKLDNKPLEQQDVTVIGGGPAGISAAIYAARKGLKVTMIADRIGGQVKDTQGIENLIGTPKTTGSELSQSMTAHLNDYPIELKEYARVTDIDNGEIKTLNLNTGEQIQTRSLIVATGAKWRELGVPGEKEYLGQGVAYCPHCDGPFFKGKDVAVIGGGNSGIEAALDLAGIVESVTVFEFMPELKADQVLIDQAKGRDNIRIITNAAVSEVLGDGNKVTGLQYLNRESEQTESVDLAGVFVQIGLVPNSQLFDGILERTQAGEIVIDERGHTSQAGIFACGDVTTVPYKQIVVAMGEGAKASLAAFEYLLTH